MMLETLLFIPPMTVAKPAEIHLVGRIDQSGGVRRSQWSATGIEVLVSGTLLTAELSGVGHVTVEVDRKPILAVALTPGSNTVNVPLAGGGQHRVRILKRTEPFVGTITWGDVSTDGKFSKPKPPQRRLEIIGDSISCGYGNLGLDRNEHFKNELEDATQTYGFLAGQAVGAETWIHAWSGKKMWPDNDIPSIYDRILPTEATPIWTFSSPAPDAIVINLGTNDFGPGNPPEAGWTAGYADFVRRVRKLAPKAVIYCATGSMMSDSYPPGARALSTLKDYLNRMVGKLGDTKVKRIDFETQTEADGIGSDWHPSVKTHQKMAARLTEALRRDLGW